MTGIITSRFQNLADENFIRSKIEVCPVAVEELESHSPQVAADILRFSLKKIFVPTPFVVGFLQEILGAARLYSQAQFKSELDYIRGIYTPENRVINSSLEVEPFCLTGLAGVGKSEAIQALFRLMPSPVGMSSGHFVGEQEIVPYWYVSARGKTSGKQMLLEFLNEQGSRSNNVGRLLSLCQSRAQRFGVPIVILDETQFITKGSGATKPADILLTLAAIGPPMLYVSNFSLLHKLKQRNQEDTQRILSKIRIMAPDELNSESWSKYMSECSRVADGRLILDMDISREIYIQTFGIKRLVVQLLSLSYLEARLSGRNHVLIDDIVKASLSSSYALNREDVKHLKSFAATGSMPGRLRPDLICPLDAPHSYMANVVSVFKEKRALQMEAKVVEASLTAAERDTLKSTEPDGGQQKKKVPVRMVAPQASDEELAANFMTLIPKPKK